MRYEYRLSDKGASLFPVIVGLKEWGDRFGAAIQDGRPMELENAATGHRIEPALVDLASGRRLDLSSVRAVAGEGASPETRRFFERLAFDRATTRRVSRG